MRILLFAVGAVLAAGLCRLFTRRGLKVRPFKPQNMSNNAAVTAARTHGGRPRILVRHRVDRAIAAP